MNPESTTKLATELLDRFFRNAEGRTNHQLDVYVTLENLGLARERAEPAIDYLKNRNLLNLFGTDIAYLTDLGVRAIAENLDITELPAADPLTSRRSSRHEDASTGNRTGVPGSPDAPNPDGRPPEAQLTRIDISTGCELTLAIGWGARIGRAPGNEICIQDKRASKHHAEVRYRDGRYELVDLDSANGTRVNGGRVGEPTTLAHEDEIVIGRTVLLFQAPLEVREPVRPRPSSSTENPARALPPIDLRAPSTTAPEGDLGSASENQLAATRAELHQEGLDGPPNVETSADLRAWIEGSVTEPGSGETSSARTPPPGREPPPSEDERPTRFERLPSDASCPAPAPTTEGPAVEEAPDRGEAAATLAPDPTTPDHSRSFDGRPPRKAASHDAQPVASSRLAPETATRSEDALGAPTSALENPATVAFDHPALAEEEPGLRADAPRPTHAPPRRSQTPEPTDERRTSPRAARPTPKRADLPDRARSSSIRHGEPSWIETLTLLRRHVQRADLPDRARLLEAIDVISDHPYVRVTLNLIDG